MEQSVSCNLTDLKLATLFLHTAFVTGVRVTPLNNTAVIVMWSPVNLPIAVYNYTIHYSTVTMIRRQSDSGTVVVMAGSSSGVVGGLMTGEQYQFSVSITVSGNGRTYTGALSNPSNSIAVISECNLYGLQLLQHVTFLDPASCPQVPGLTGAVVVGWLLLFVSIVGNVIMIVIIMILLKKKTGCK